ncbi:MAG TPA: hypothetical protein VMD30_02515 [Tepidisphaeraceae bacterium]|nr:hypothetical protein [Tepidisphaeraceae bacterium]
MKSSIHIALLVVVAFCGSSFFTHSSTVARPVSADASQAAVAGGQRKTVADMSYFLPPLRLRKLHLVRPDLIPFPLDVEVVC